jgi:hypothetical protein
MGMFDTRAVASGFAGAGVLTVLHEMQKRALPEPARLDVLGMRAIARGLRAAGKSVPEERSLHRSALAGDLAVNTLYYSLVGLSKRPILTGGLLGLAAGVASVLLPQRLKLGKEPTRHSGQTSAAAVALYTAAGLTAGAVHSILTSSDWPVGEWEEAFFP